RIHTNTGFSGTRPNLTAPSTGGGGSLGGVDQRAGSADLKPHVVLGATGARNTDGAGRGAQRPSPAPLLDTWPRRSKDPLGHRRGFHALRPAAAKICARPEGLVCGLPPDRHRQVAWSRTRPLAIDLKQRRLIPQKIHLTRQIRPIHPNPLNIAWAEILIPRHEHVGLSDHSSRQVQSV